MCQHEREQRSIQLAKNHKTLLHIHFFSFSLQASDDSVEEHAFDDIKNLMRVSYSHCNSINFLQCAPLRQPTRSLGNIIVGECFWLHAAFAVHAGL